MTPWVAIQANTSTGVIGAARNRPEGTLCGGDSSKYHTPAALSLIATTRRCGSQIGWIMKNLPSLLHAGRPLLIVYASDFFLVHVGSSGRKRYHTIAVWCYTKQWSQKIVFSRNVLAGKKRKHNCIGLFLAFLIVNVGAENRTKWDRITEVLLYNGTSTGEKCKKSTKTANRELWALAISVAKAALFKIMTMMVCFRFWFHFHYWGSIDGRRFSFLCFIWRRLRAIFR